VIVEVLELHRAVVRLDGEHLAQERLETQVRVALVRGLVLLEESPIGAELNGRQRRHRDRIAALGKVAHRL
jgi:hypothetical protein